MGLFDPVTGEWRSRNVLGGVTSFFYGNTGDITFREFGQVQATNEERRGRLPRPAPSCRNSALANDQIKASSAPTFDQRAIDSWTPSAKAPIS